MVDPWASHLECDDARVSRSSRGMKYIVSGKSCEAEVWAHPRRGWLVLTPCILAKKETSLLRRIQARCKDLTVNQ